jgi:DNA repair exonuclease SbcCD ATPase subunit
MKRAALVLLLLAPGLASAQGLGDAAKREQKKRQTTQAKEPRVYDNDDLQPPGTAKKDKDKDSAGAGGNGSAAVSQEPYDTSREDAEAAAARERQEHARTALATAEESLARLEARVKSLQDQLNPMSPSFIYGASAGMSAPGAEMRVREELRNAEAQLPDARQAVEEARKELEAVASGHGSGAR